jgi:hypothetical protein
MGGMAVLRLKTPPLIVDWLLAKTLRLCSVLLHMTGNNLLLLDLAAEFLNRGGSFRLLRAWVVFCLMYSFLV